MIDDADARMRLLEERSRRLAQRRATHAPGLEGRGSDYLVVACGDARYGLDPAALAAVTPMQNYAPLPGAAAGCLGLISRAGAYYALYDLAALLQAAPATGSGMGRGVVLVLRRSAPLCALRADAVLGTRRASLVAASPGLHGLAAADALAGYASQDNLPILDPDRLVARMRGGARPASGG